MASSKDYLQFILEQLSDLEGITYRAMMGEYILYYRGKIVGGIYDDRLLVKPIKSAVSYMPEAAYELPEQVFIRLKEYDPQELCISSVTYAELVHGVEKSKATEKNRVALALLLANIDIVSFDSLAAQSYGKIRADLEKAGTPIGPLDMMIAGHAKSLNYFVVTNNTKEFERVKGLKLENWAV